MGRESREEVDLEEARGRGPAGGDVEVSGEERTEGEGARRPLPRGARVGGGMGERALGGDGETEGERRGER